MKITPEWFSSFETLAVGLTTGNWQRVQKMLFWDRVMKRRTGKTKREVLTWLLETAGLYPEGNGGNKRFDAVVATSTALEHENFGSGLRLRKTEIEDNQMQDNPNVGALDYGAKWFRDEGSLFAWHPQERLIQLIKQGLVAIGYDGVPFFSAVHPVDPSLPGGATYSNIITGVDLTLDPATITQDKLVAARLKLAKAFSIVRSATFGPNKVPRGLEPRVILCPTQLADAMNLIVSAPVIAQTSNTLQGSIEVIACPQLDNEPNVFYIGVEDILSDELGAFVYSEREPFSIKMYGPMEQVQLDRLEVYEWHADGRNTTMYGHPYLFFRCTA